MAVTAEQPQAILDAAVGRIEATTAPPGSGRGGGRQVLAKYMRCETFSGGDWGSWAFSFKRGVRAQNQEVFKALQNAETMEDVISEEVDVPVEQEARSGELYDVLCQFCAGEALGIVRSTTDMQGFAAWQKLHRKYNPKTMARGVRMLGRAVNPTQVKELNDIEVRVNAWEDELRTLQLQYGEALSPFMKIAVFTNMMPTTIQDYIYGHVEKDVPYEELRDKVQAMVGNKIATTMGPAPMDVGAVAWQPTAGEASADDGGEWGVDAVWPSTQCHQCWGYGHLARDCPTKGPGKGGKGAAHHSGNIYPAGGARKRAATRAP